MADERPTRWKRARSDWSGIHAKREALLGVVGGITTAGVLALVGSGGAVETLIAAAVGAVLTIVLFPLAELWWSWLQAPHRMVLDELAGLRSQVALLESPTPAPQATHKRSVSLRTALLDEIRKGREVANLSYPPTELVLKWTNNVVDLLTEYGSDEMTEQFLNATTKASVPGMLARLTALEELAEALKG